MGVEDIKRVLRGTLVATCFSVPVYLSQKMQDLYLRRCKLLRRFIRRSINAIFVHKCAMIIALSRVKTTKGVLQRTIFDFRPASAVKKKKEKKSIMNTSSRLAQRSMPFQAIEFHYYHHLSIADSEKPKPLSALN